MPSIPHPSLPVSSLCQAPSGVSARRWDTHPSTLGLNGLHLACPCAQEPPQKSIASQRVFLEPLTGGREVPDSPLTSRHRSSRWEMDWYDLFLYRENLGLGGPQWLRLAQVW